MTVSHTAISPIVSQQNAKTSVQNGVLLGTKGAIPQANSPYLSDISPKDKPWDTHRAQAERITHMYAADMEFRQLAYRVANCSGILHFAWHDADGQAKLKLFNAFFCRVRHCPVCQWRRSMMWQAKLFQAIPDIQAKYPKHSWIFLTLTVKNCAIADLRSTLKTMNSAWQRLSQRKAFSTVSGFIRSTEVTRGADGSAHPHFHALLLVPPSYFKGENYISQAKFVELWKASLGVSYTPVVDVRRVKGDIERAVAETLKYAVKPSDMEADQEWFFEMTRQLHKSRFLATGGVLKDILKSETEITNADLVTADSEPVGDLLSKQAMTYHWNATDARYKRRFLPPEPRGKKE